MAVVATAAARRARRRRGVRTRRLVRGLVGAVACFALAEAITRLELVDLRYLPRASTVLARLVGLLGQAEFLTAVAATLQAWAIGLAIAVAVAVPAGILLGSSRRCYQATRALVEFLRPIPSVALIPLAILLFGQGLQLKTSLIAYASFWPLLFNTVYGVQDVDPIAKDTARSFGLGRLAVLGRVTLPAASPFIATGVRVASAIALILAISTELLAGAAGGIGSFILRASSGGGNADLVYAATAMTGVLGLVLNWALLLVAVAWQLATMGGRSIFFPPLTEILSQARTSWLSGPASSAFLTPAVASDVLPSLGRLLGGWLLAVAAGVSVGTAIGLVRNLADYLDPVIEFVRAIPPPAMIPPFLVVLGLGSDMKIALIAVGVVWPILLNTIDGVRSVDPVLMDTGRTFRTGRLRRLGLIVLPSASPRIFAGLRVSLSLALILMVISEMVAASGGIGFTIVQAERSFAITQMWAGILLLGVLGYLLNSLLLLVERRVLAWHRGARGTQESA